MKNPRTSVKVKLESHLKNVCLHFRMLLSEGWMTKWILEQEESTGQIGFNLAQMIAKLPKLELQSL